MRQILMPQPHQLIRQPRPLLNPLRQIWAKHLGHARWHGGDDKGRVGRFGQGHAGEGFLWDRSATYILYGALGKEAIGSVLCFMIAARLCKTETMPVLGHHPSSTGTVINQPISPVLCVRLLSPASCLLAPAHRPWPAPHVPSPLPPCPCSFTSNTASHTQLLSGALRVSLNAIGYMRSGQKCTYHQSPK